jgi:transposase
VVLQQALADLNAAYRNFFASLNGKRKGPKVAPPRFRSRKDRRQAIRFTRNARFAVTPGGQLRLPKIGDVPVRWSRLLPGVPSSVTVIKDAAGRYFASFVVQAGEDVLPQADAETGIEFGRTGRFEPTSQVCSACGVKDGPKPLAVRAWTCAACGTVHDRDVNAARNVLALGRRESLNARGGQVRPAPVLAPAGEAGNRRSAA